MRMFAWIFVSTYCASVTRLSIVIRHKKSWWRSMPIPSLLQVTNAVICVCFHRYKKGSITLFHFEPRNLRWYDGKVWSVSKKIMITKNMKLSVFSRWRRCGWRFLPYSSEFSPNPEYVGSKTFFLPIVNQTRFCCGSHPPVPSSPAGR